MTMSGTNPSHAPALDLSADEPAAAREPRHDPPGPDSYAKQPRRAAADDWLTAAVVFATLGGCAALWLFDLSPLTGAIAAISSGLAGILFADS